MKICIPTADDRGLEAPLSDHFGSAPCLTFVDTTSGTVEIVENSTSHHAHGQCDPAAAIGSADARVVVCRGLGRRALERLQGLGVQVFVTRETTARRALEAHAAGHAIAMTADLACGGGGHCDHRGATEDH
jgi:predicted Fe-Mo cluster-binding NifX family protein